MPAYGADIHELAGEEVKGDWAVLEARVDALVAEVVSDDSEWALYATLSAWKLIYQKKT